MAQSSCCFYTVLEQKVEIEQLTHQQEMERSKVEHKMEMEKRSEEEKRRKWEVEKKGQLQATNMQDQQQLDYYKNLHGLGVDLNQYVQSLTPRPEKVTRIVAADNSTNLHLHHS
ncbi:uncharacterized protein LOC128558278 [Mercenaria mercenaria]|uniref:uncharacterized protein LOC128558278 n=1 Tax=Mercenaria mercenaria TaxID=6596 RepID=UPI00234E87A4|nr:uncharacterized protein LOC128558278 [Mercenaria mercenaria]